MLKKILKYLTIIFVAFLLLFVLLGLFTQTPLFRSWLKNTVVKQVNKSLNAELTIGEIDGNLFQTLQLSGVLLKSDQDSLISVKSLDIKIRPLLLLQKLVFVDVIRVDNLALFVKQQNDSLWNFQQVVPQKQNVELPDTAKTHRPFDWKIDLQNVQVVNGSINFQPIKKSVIPGRIENINVDLSLTLNGDGLQVALKDFHLKTYDPNFVLSSLSFVLRQQEKNLLIDDFLLQTPKSSIHLKAELEFTESPNYKVSLQSESLSLIEISSFLGANLPDLSPQINLDFVLQNNNADLDMMVKTSSEQIHLDGTIQDPFKNPKYNLNCDLKNFNPGNWVPENRFADRISGDLKIDGHGTNPKTLAANLSARLYGPVEKSSIIQKLSLNGHLLNNVLNADFSLDGIAGKMQGQVKLKQITKNPNYSVKLSAQNLNLFPVLKDSLYASDLQLEATLNGAGFEFPQMNAEIDAQISSSTFSGYHLDSLSLAANFQNGDYSIQTLDLRSPYLNAHANGAGDLHSIKIADVLVDLVDMKELSNVLNRDVSATGGLEAQIYGPFDSLSATASLGLKNVIYGNIVINSVSNKSNGILRKSKFFGQSHLRIGGGEIQNINLDTLSLDLGIEDHQFNYELDLTVNDTLQARLEASTTLDSAIKTNIKNLVLELGEQKWTSDSMPMLVKYGQSRVSIQDFVLNNQKQVISINGYIEPAGDQNLQLTIKGLSLAPVLQLSGIVLPWTLTGLIDLDAFLFGTTQIPKIKSQLLLQNLVVQKMRFPELLAAVEYSDEHLKLKSDFNQQEKGSLNFSIDAPFHLSFSDSSRLFDKEKPIIANVDAVDFDLAFLSVLTPQQDQINAVLNAKLKAESALPEPTISGQLTLKNGAYFLNEFGLDYQDIALDIKVEDDKLTVNELSAKAGPGKLIATGSAQFSKGQYLKGPKELNLLLKGEKFQVAKSPGLEMIANSNISLNGNPDEIVFGGNVEVVRSKINLAALPGGQTRNNALVKPRLIQAQKDSVFQQKIKPKQDSPAAQNLRGRMNLKIPRNTWVRSEDMNIELSGDLELVKKGPFFELFGNVKTIRGTYNLYGRRFNISEGEVIFQGGKDLNPVINLAAVYSFRNIQGDKTNLTLKTTGTLQKPEIAFQLNDQAIEEADGISYIVFGKSSNDLSRGEKSQVSKQGGSGAQITSVLSGQVTGQLTKAIQKTFNLDVMEFRGGSNWRQASIVIGKYLTNDLYMAYEREFNVGKTQDVVPEKVSLEYEITPRIFIQATKGDDKSTGVDVIWKIEKK